MSKTRGTNVPDQPTIPPMPKKHRYIDESILVEKLHVGEGLPTISRSVLVNCVLPTIPTADVRENVKGRWIDYRENRWIYARCSECGTVHDTKTNFCPYCGADMRGEA